MITTLSLIALVLWLAYKYWVARWNDWEKRGFPSLPAKFPFGTRKELVIFNKFIGETLQQVYNEGAPHPYIGLYHMRVPVLVLRDPEIISIVLTKNFSHFRDRQAIHIPDYDHLSQHLFMLQGDKWKTVRMKLTPTFTSGKLKAMFPLIVECSEAYDKFLHSNVKKDFDVKEFVGRFTTDVICSCAFGMNTNAINEPDNKLRKIGLSSLEFKTKNILNHAALTIWPGAFHFFKLRMSSKDTEDFLIKFFRDTVEYRETNNLKRNDFMDLMIQLLNKGTIEEGEVIEDGSTPEPVEMTVELLTAQAFVFFLAGFETSSSVQTFTLYELALNPDIQTKLQEEIDRVIAKHGDLTYQAVKDMKYLDMVISEAMRKYPTLPLLDRICNKELTLPNGGTILKGDKVKIPVWGLHHDPEYFPKPEQFDPERFSEENVGSIVPYTYLPFGEGPRVCIAVRFAKDQTKLGIITLLRKYRVEPCETTQIPVEFKAKSFLTNASRPITLRLVERTDVKEMK